MMAHGVENLVRDLWRSGYRIISQNFGRKFGIKYGVLWDQLDDYVFQKDNNPKHTSKLVKKWIANRGLEMLDWPAQSPDLNIIECLWVHFKRKLLDYEIVLT